MQSSITGHCSLLGRQMSLKIKELSSRSQKIIFFLTAISPSPHSSTFFIFYPPPSQMIISSHSPSYTPRHLHPLYSAQFQGRSRRIWRANVGRRRRFDTHRRPPSKLATNDTNVSPVSFLNIRSATFARYSASKSKHVLFFACHWHRFVCWCLFFFLHGKVGERNRNENGVRKTEQKNKRRNNKRISKNI